jgi:DNA polymerase-3 subunit epsilon
VTGWHLGLMLGLDCETTGKSVETDRVVTACTAWVDGTGKTKPRSHEWLAWPGIEIPAAATAVHGIKTETARDMGLPAVQVVHEVSETIASAVRQGVPLVLFNAAYDLTLLDRETRRHGLDPLGSLLVGALVIDPLVIDKAVDRYRKGKRTLGAIAEHYGVTPEGAHSATGDVITTVRLAWMIARRNPKVAQMPPAELLAWQAQQRKEQAASLEEHFRKQGKPEPVDGSWPLKPWTGDQS